MTRRVAGRDKFRLANLPASADLSHVGDLANLTYIPLGYHKTATNLTQNSSAQIPSKLAADVLVIRQNLL